MKEKRGREDGNMKILSKMSGKDVSGDNESWR